MVAAVGHEKVIIDALHDAVVRAKHELADARLSGDGRRIRRKKQRFAELQGAFGAVARREAGFRTAEDMLREIVDAIDDGVRNELISKAAEYLISVDAFRRAAPSGRE